MSENESKRSNFLALILVAAVVFQIFLSVLILKELRALRSAPPPSAMAQAEESRGLDAGTEAPDFSLLDSQGEQVSLADFADRKVMLVFSSDECKYCKLMYPELERLHSSGEYADVEVVLMQIGSTPEENEALRQETGFDFPVLAADQQVFSAYEVPGTPFSTLVSESGTVVAGGHAGNYEAMTRLLGSVVAN